MSIIDKLNTLLWEFTVQLSRNSSFTFQNINSDQNFQNRQLFCAIGFGIALALL